MKELNSAWLMLTTKCNLRCKYCWLTKYGSGKDSSSMSMWTARQSILFIKKYGKEGAGITFFGGEPLMEFDTIKTLMDENRSMNFGLFTNGTLLDDEKIGFFKKRRDFIRITVSIDGTQQSNRDSRGTGYDEAIMCKVFGIFPTSEVRYTVLDPALMYDGVKALEGIGAKNVVINIPHFVSLSKDYYKTFRDELERIRSNYFLSAVTKMYESHNDCSRSFCKAGIDFVAIAPSGDVYPCDLFYWLGEGNIGNVYSGISQESVDFFKSRLDIEKTCHTSCVAEQLYCRDIAISNERNFKQ